MGDRAGIARPVPTSTLLVKNIQRLATLNAALGEIDDGAIYVKGNVIKWVGKTAELPNDLVTADIVVSLDRHVVIPGLVNTHHHMVQALTRCVAQVRSQCLKVQISTNFFNSFLQPSRSR
jgi:8-oxoguanine deaminase